MTSPPVSGVVYIFNGTRWSAPGRDELPLSLAYPDETIAVISSNPTEETPLRSALTARGWSTVWFYGVAGKTINGTDSNGKTAVDVITQARAELGLEPTMWVIDLGQANTSTDAGAQTSAVLAALGTAARRVVWAGVSYPNGSTDANAVAVRAVVEPLVTAHQNAVYAEWQLWNMCHKDTTWWSSGSLTAEGRTAKAACLEVHIGAPENSNGVWWNPTKLPTYVAPARAGRTVTDIRNVPGWNPLDDLKTNLARLTTSSDVYLPSGEWKIFGFQGAWLGGIRLGQAGTGGQTLVKGFVGDGRELTKIKLQPYSSTDAALVPTTDGSINPLDIMVFKDIPNLLLQNLTIAGSPQGHNYNGIALFNCVDAIVEGVCFKGAASCENTAYNQAAQPPGETFAMDINQATNLQILNCEFDGRFEDTGARVSSSMIGFNGPGSSRTAPANHSQQAHLENIWYHDGRTGMLTFWLWDSAVTVNFWYDDSAGTAINHEEAGYETRPIMHFDPEFVIRGYYESRQPSPLPNCNTANRSLHFTQLSGYHDTKNIRMYFLRPEDTPYVRGVGYKRHDRGPSLEIGALGVNNGDGYPTGAAGSNKAVTQAHIFKSLPGNQVKKLTPILYTAWSGYTSDTAFIYYR